MGSFTELVLAVTLDPEAPAQALAAFAPWKTGDGAPPLSLLDDFVSVEEQQDIAYDVEMAVTDGDGDAVVAGLPLLQRAVAWNALLAWSTNAYFPGTPTTTLRWIQSARRWTLTTRTLPKMGGETVQALIAVLGELAVDGSFSQPRFVGYIKDEDVDPPVLIYSLGKTPFQFRSG